MKTSAIIISSCLAFANADCGWTSSCGPRGCADCKDDGSAGYQACCKGGGSHGGGGSGGGGGGYQCGWTSSCGPRGCADCKDDGSAGYQACCKGGGSHGGGAGSASTTRYWDCGGGGCGEGVNCPNAGGCQQFWSGAACASHNAAMRSVNYMGATVYGTAAASDGFFGCGQCALLTSPTGGKMVVRVNNQCPGSSNPACKEAHFDIAVPGFDNLQYSVNNQCNVPPHNCDPAINSNLCAHGSIGSCNCDGVSSDPIVRTGCHLFQSLAWGDNPRVSYKKVPCPGAEHFVEFNSSSSIVV